MPAFDLTFGEAHHGWLDVSLHVGEYTADLSASGVLNDPLEESVDVAVALSAEEHVYSAFASGRNRDGRSFALSASASRRV